MNSNVEVTELQPADWQRLRSLRLESLADSPHAYGASHEVESELSQDVWLERMAKAKYFAASIDDNDCAIMSVEELDGDFGANIWLGGCWVNPDVRGTGVMKAMIDFIDSVAFDRGWQCQGLGVWHDNHPAIAAYERLGFEAKGDLQESSRKPGLFFQRMIRHTK
ncbi:MAG: GNAT family N-acetyltransferase [Actinobacteria bacterium]|nr:GNAT family N-acetyltransferase [Actinomycetota bacterium]